MFDIRGAEIADHPIPPLSPTAHHMVTISEIKAREILDSRGNPTVEADVYCSTA